jgi:hypothetical protein
MKLDRHLFESFTSLNQSTKFGYGSQTSYILEVLSWKIAKQGSVSSILEILYVFLERRANGRHGASQQRLRKLGGSPGIDGAKGERVQASVPR